MIRLMLRAAGLALAPRPAQEQALAPTPEEQLRRFAEVCERLPAGDEPAEDAGADQCAAAPGTHR